VVEFTLAVSIKRARNSDALEDGAAAKPGAPEKS
jgi:hypothetical protein